MTARGGTRGIATCPYCDRTVTTDGGRYTFHTITPGKKAESDRCPLADQHVPVTGSAPADYVSRAYLIADLADQVQDRDLAPVWAYLTCLPADELQRLLMITLAAVPAGHRPVSDVWAWVTELPAAKAVGE